jgi:nitrilase
MSELAVAVIQYCPTADRKANLRTAAELLAEARSMGARLAVLPELFSAFVPAGEWRAVAELAAGPVEEFLSGQAAQHRMFVVGGSYIEKTREGAFHNTSPIFSPEGRVIDRYRKMHLFWTDIPGTTRYDERSYLSCGDRRVVFDADGFRVAVGICYDLRFPEFFRFPGGAAADLYCLPSAFMYATGCAHWEVLVRGRAIENLAYFAAAGTVGCHYEVAGRAGEMVETFGHSMIVSPWGEIVEEVREGRGIAVAKISRAQIDEARSRLGALEHTREDLWPRPK